MPRCRDFNADIDRMWAALDHLPGIEPKDNFNRGVRARIEARRPSGSVRGSASPGKRSRAGMAVSAILVCLVGAWPRGAAPPRARPGRPVTRNRSPHPVTGVVTGPTAPVAAAPSAAQPIGPTRRETMLREVNDL